MSPSLVCRSRAYSRPPLPTAAPQPPQQEDAGHRPLPAPSPSWGERTLGVRASALPILSWRCYATHGPACRPHRPTALRSRADAAAESNGQRTDPSRVLPQPPQRAEAAPVAIVPKCLCVQTASARRTRHVSARGPCLLSCNCHVRRTRSLATTLPDVRHVSPPTRKREGAGASPGSLSYDG